MLWPSVLSGPQRAFTALRLGMTRRPHSHFSASVRVSLLLRELKRSGWRGMRAAAEDLRMSTSTIRHLIKRQTGFSMREFMMIRRLHFAAVLLITSTRSIKDIQYRCRFSDAAQFSHKFRNHFQVSPSAFRRLHGNVPANRRQQRPIDCACGMTARGYNRVGLKKVGLNTPCPPPAGPAH